MMLPRASGHLWCDAALLAPTIHLHGNSECLSTLTDKTCIKNGQGVGWQQKALEVPSCSGQMHGSFGKAVEGA